MKERLVIKNFGPIKEADLTFGRFNVLIGEQATGKSSVAKLLAVFRYFSYILPSSHSLNSPFEDGLSAWGLGDFVQYGKTEFFYDCEHYTFNANSTVQPGFDPQTGEPDGESHEFITQLQEKSEQFKILISELERIRPKPQSKYDLNAAMWQVPTSFFQNEVASVLDNPFYFPVERGLQSIFSLGKNSIRNVSDSLFNQLAELDKIARQLEDVIIEPLNIQYHNERGSGWVIRNDRVTPIEFSASGYQSTIPVVFGIKYYTDLRKKQKTFIIEEPELNLFPTAQYELMKFLVDKTMNYGNTMLIATHSPYVLSALNNLMNAHQSGTKDKEATEAIVSERYWLNTTEVSAYLLKSDGTCEDIIDYEEGMIKSEKIDEVSGILNREFDQLLNIQFGIKDANS